VSNGSVRNGGLERALTPPVTKDYAWVSTSSVTVMQSVNQIGSSMHARYALFEVTTGMSVQSTEIQVIRKTVFRGMILFDPVFRVLLSFLNPLVFSVGRSSHSQ